jgi:hypothetical protein
MGTQKMSGLTKRGGIWHIDKVFRGTRIRESTGTGEIVKAQELLAKRIDEIRAAQLYGARPDRTFRAAATKFLNENQHKRSIDDDAAHLERPDPFTRGVETATINCTSWLGQPVPSRATAALPHEQPPLGQHAE